MTSSRFARNVAVLAAGTAGAQAISMAFSPLITRIYGPESFGMLGTFVSIVAIMTTVASFSYPIAIVLPKEDKEAVTLSILSFGISIAVACAVATAVLLCGDQLASAANVEEIYRYLIFVPMAMVFSTLLLIMNQWVIRRGLFRLNAKVAFLQSALLNVAQVALGLLMPIAAVLIIISTFGAALQALMLRIGCRIGDGSMPWKRQRSVDIFYDMLSVAKKYKDFPYYRTPQAFLNAASQGMPLLVLASLFGPKSAGFYSLSRLVLAAPTNLIGQSVASVFYPRINEATNNGDDTRGLLVKSTFYLSVLGLLPFGIVFLFGPWLFAYIFGDQWYTAGSYAQWMALWSYFGFINRPAVASIPVLSLQKMFLVYEILSIAIRAVGLVAGFVIFNSALGSVAIFSVISGISNVVLIWITIRSVPKMRGGTRGE